MAAGIEERVKWWRRRRRRSICRDEATRVFWLGNCRKFNLKDYLFLGGEKTLLPF